MKWTRRLSQADDRICVEGQTVHVTHIPDVRKAWCKMSTAYQIFSEAPPPPPPARAFFFFFFSLFF